VSVGIYDCGYAGYSTSLTAAYALALFLLAVGTWGWLGAERDPLSGIFLIPLGMLWTLFIGSVGKFDPFGGVSPAVLAMLAPAINLAILFSICSTLRRRHSLSKR
jgi:hypothetical protein